MIPTRPPVARLRHFQAVLIPVVVRFGTWAMNRLIYSSPLIHCSFGPASEKEIEELKIKMKERI